MSAVAAAPRLKPRPAPVCECGFDQWSHPWPGRPRRCMRCGGLNEADLPCRHLHFHAGTELCSDCELPPDDSKLYRERRLGELRPSDLDIGERAACTAPLRRDLSDQASPEEPCGYVTMWRRNGQPWCERHWWTTRAGLDLLKELRAVVQP